MQIESNKSDTISSMCQEILRKFLKFSSFWKLGELLYYSTTFDTHTHTHTQTHTTHKHIYLKYLVLFSNKQGISYWTIKYFCSEKFGILY